VPSEANGQTEDLISGNSQSPAIQSSGTDRSGRVRPVDEQTDGLDELGTIALQNSSGKIPIARKIEIDCRAGSLQVGNRTVYFGAPNAVSLRDAMPAIVQELQKEMATWGRAGMTFRWQPKLMCVVYSGGLEMYYGLRMVLIGSPIEIDHVIALEDEMDWSDSVLLQRVAGLGSGME
jgi:hypothetical protein